MNAKTFNEKNFDVGDYLFKEGDEGEEAYLIKSGQIKISRQVGENDQRTIATIGKGDIIGEMALIDGKPRAATAICIEPVTVVVVTGELLQQRLAKTDPVVMQLLNTFTKRLREQADIIATYKNY